MKAGIVGATGYGGAELIRILNHHPQFELASLYSSSRQGESINNQYPHLTGCASHVLEEIDAYRMAQELDVIFLAVPSGVASQMAPELAGAGCTVIDLSGDFRLNNPSDYEKWYKKSPPSSEWSKKAVYSIPELCKEKLAKDSLLISNPGCYPTATLLGLAPLASNRLVREESVIVDAKSGVSGAGQTVALGNIFCECNENLKIYKVNQHQHIPEIEQMLKAWGYMSPITFSTHLVPMSRGIMATIYLTLNEHLDEDEVLQLYTEFYEDSSFIRVRQRGEFPSTKEVTGSNFCDIGVTVDTRTKRVTIVSVIDNLMKGAAGQAVQNANLLFGMEETAGLAMTPFYP
ncbi:MAG TPA: N-acetyl-gamma-glutamyl-phosphate reductase [Bacillaceae bacterium]